VDSPRIRKFALRATPDGHILGLERYELPSQAGIARWVLLEGQPVHVPDVGADPRYHPSIDSLPGLRTSACLAAPLKVRDAILGVLVAVNRSTPRRSTIATCASSRSSRIRRRSPSRTRSSSAAPSSSR